MNKLETLASDIALLSNSSLDELAQILVRDYGLRADVLATYISAHSEDALREIELELGCAE
jgi:Flp pilus assembly CpaF family ATPase